MVKLSIHYIELFPEEKWRNLGWKKLELYIPRFADYCPVAPLNQNRYTVIFYNFIAFYIFFTFVEGIEDDWTPHMNNTLYVQCI